MSNFSEQELVELQFEMASIEENFTDLKNLFDIEEIGGDAADNDALSELDIELEEAGLGDMTGATSSSPSLMSLVEEDFAAADFDEQGFGWFKKKIFGTFKRKIKRLLKKLVRLVKKHAKLAKCVPAVTKAVVLFKRGKYRSAATAAWSAYRCIKKRL